MDDYERAKAIYGGIKQDLRHLKGKIVAVETDSGDYFIADDELSAVGLGRQKYPGEVFFLFRIGFKAVTWHGMIPYDETMV